MYNRQTNIIQDKSLRDDEFDVHAKSNGHEESPIKGTIPFETGRMVTFHALCGQKWFSEFDSFAWSCEFKKLISVTRRHVLELFGGLKQQFT